MQNNSNLKEKGEKHPVDSYLLCELLPGSPKRRPFQRQRAASETTDHSEDDSLSLRDEVIDSFPQSPIQTSGLQSLSAESLSHADTAPTSSVFLSR